MNLLRHPTLRLLNLPALLAVLLLAMVPTLGRLASAPATAHHHSASVALCTVTGLRSVQLDLLSVHDAAPPAAPDHQHHDDCAYCPLLAGLAQLPIAPALTLSPPDTGTRQQVESATRTAFIVDTGLGARGPPDSIASITV